jgi:hypothetical protein
VATAPVKKPAPEPKSARAFRPPQELVAPPRHATMPDFLDKKSVKATKEKTPSVIWPRVWQALRHPSFVWLAGAATLLLLAGVVSLGKFITGTPGYAISQVELAIRQHNGTKLAYYADAAGIVSQVVDETTDWLVAHRGMGTVAGLDGVAEAHGKREKVQAAKVAMTDKINRQIGAALISHQRDSVGIARQVVWALSALPPVAQLAGGDHFDVTAVGQPVVHGERADLPVMLQYRELQVDIPVGIIMQHQGRRWRVVGVSGLREALDVANRAQVERLAMDNRSITQRIAATLDVGTPSVVRKAHGRKRTTYLLQVPITNRSTDTVLGVMLGLATRTSGGPQAMQLEVQHPIAGGATSSEVWQFDESSAAHSAVATMLAHPDRLVVHVRDLVIDSAGQADTMRAVPRSGSGQ